MSALLDLYGVHSRSPSVADKEISILQTKCEVISTPGHSVIHKSFIFQN